MSRPGKAKEIAQDVWDLRRKGLLLREIAARHGVTLNTVRRALLLMPEIPDIVQRDRAKKSPRDTGPVDVPSHGLTGYHRGCRCEVCKTARRTYSAARRDKLQALAKEGKLPDHHHGTYGYLLGCRCDTCTEVGRGYYRNRARKP